MKKLSMPPEQIAFTTGFEKNIRTRNAAREVSELLKQFAAEKGRARGSKSSRGLCIMVRRDMNQNVLITSCVDVLDVRRPWCYTVLHFAWGWPGETLRRREDAENCQRLLVLATKMHEARCFQRIETARRRLGKNFGIRKYVPSGRWRYERTEIADIMTTNGTHDGENHCVTI